MSSATRKLFTPGDIWDGGFYELALEFPKLPDTQLFTAFSALWSHPTLEGFYLDEKTEPHEQPRVPMSRALFDPSRHLFGLATLPNGQISACGSVMIREELDGRVGSDWLDLYIPMGALGQIYDVGPFPFDDNAQKDEFWRKPLEDWFAAIGFYVYARVPFQLGLIGHEVSGRAYAAQLTQKGIPSERWDGYLWSVNGVLRYFPRNITDPPMVIP